MTPDVFAWRRQALKTLGRIPAKIDSLQGRSLVAPAATGEHGQEGQDQEQHRAKPPDTKTVGHLDHWDGGIHQRQRAPNDEHDTK